MEAVKKYCIWGIFISILSILAMSHNVNAIELTINLDNYSLKRNSNRPNLTLYWNNDLTTCNNVGQCRVFDSTDFSFVKRMSTNTAYDAKANDIFILRMFVGSQSRTGPYTHIATFNQRNFTTNNDYLIYLGENVFKVDEARILSDLGYGPNADEFYTRLSNYYYDLRIYEYYFRVVRDGNYNVGFESTNYLSNAGDIFALPAYSTDGAVYFQILNLTQYQATESKENKEVEEKTQEAVDESQTAGGDSSSSAQTGTTGLLNAITGAVSVISSAQPTNCKINGNMGNLDMGQLDLCANPAPAFVQTIGSLILILMCVPLAISLFNRFIAIFRSFQS